MNRKATRHIFSSAGSLMENMYTYRVPSTGTITDPKPHVCTVTSHQLTLCLAMT